MGSVLIRLRAGFTAVIGVLALAFVCYRVLHADSTIAATVLVLAILLVSTFSRLSEAIAASLVATLCLDYWFVPPIGSVTIGSPEGWIVLVVFLAVSLVVTKLSGNLRRQHEELVSRQRESEKLHALSRAMLLTEAGEDMGRLIVNKCIELFRFTEATLYVASTGTSHGYPQNGSLIDSDSPGITNLPLNLGNKSLGSLAFRGPRLSTSALHSLANTVSLGIAQAQAREASSRAEAVRKSEELKSVMIDALAHDLKTPLTVIDAACDVLAGSAELSPAQRDDLTQMIQQESKGLKRMMDEAIHLARIEAKQLHLESVPSDVNRLVEAAIVSLGARASAHEIRTDIQDLPEVIADTELLVQALKQLIDNALKYSPAQAAITIRAYEMDGMVTIAIRDQGQGLTELEQARVFNKFYRGRYDRSAVQGTGMGLAIVKEIVEAHGGSAGVISEFGSGSEFFVRLPIAIRSSESLAPAL